jgi:hypothetical protein
MRKEPTKMGDTKDGGTKERAALNTYLYAETNKTTSMDLVPS